MTENLHDLLKQDNPTALPRIERALISQDDLSADQEAVLGALSWQRCTSGAAGLLAFAAFVRITVITSGRANARILPKAVIDTKWSEQQKGDLIAGSTNSFIAKLVERRMRYVMLVKVSGKETQTFVAALVSQVQYLLREPRRTLTWDCGKELADHESLNAGHRSRHLLLRAPQSLATPHQRKHKQAPAPVLSERYRLLHRQ